MSKRLHGGARRRYDVAMADFSSPAALLDQGVALHQQGRLSEAEKLYRQVLRRQPEHPWALNLLGVAASQGGRHAEAEGHLRQALLAQPGVPDFLNNLALALQGQGKRREAEATFRQALAAKGDFADAWNGLGTVCLEEGRLEDALAAFTQAAAEPHQAAARFNAGNVLAALGRLPDAAERYRQVTALNPAHQRAWARLGLVEHRLGRRGEAEDALRRALALEPQPDLACDLGLLVEEGGRLDEAEAFYHQALQWQPDHALAHNNLGRLYALRGRQEEALNHLLQAHRLAPESDTIAGNLGAVLLDIRQPGEAIRWFERALALRPGNDEVLANLGLALMMTGRVEEAVETLRRALALNPGNRTAHSNLIFALDMHPDAGPAEQQCERRAWQERFAAPLAATWLPHANAADPERPLVVGYVSADFRRHSAALAFAPMLLDYDRNRFRVLAYNNGLRGDAMTDTFRRGVDAWRDIAGLGDEEAARLIRADGVDILVDLSGHTAGNRLLVFARRPAPVQITAWGYGNGTGLAAMDYLFSDPVSIPAGERPLYAEEIVDLPCQFAWSSPDEAPPVGELPLAERGHVTFGVFCRLAKISGQSLALWAGILQALPTARIVFKSMEFNDAGERARLLSRLEGLGVAAARVDILGATPWAEHLAAMSAVDIALDPIPHGGGVGVLESLWMGVPALTLQGGSLPGRLGAAILAALELEEWIVESRDGYVELACAMAGRPEKLAELRRTLRSRVADSPLGHRRRLVAAVEEAYRGLWRRWCRRRIEAGA